ncbi:MAG: alkaline phosphatase family protein, partial [Pyrinomonadaceae bacterium]
MKPDKSINFQPPHNLKSALPVILLLAAVGFLLIVGLKSGVVLQNPAPTLAAETIPARAASDDASLPADAQDLRKIKHVVIIMQENRSFDSYFGTFPGADGIPMNNGEPSVCVPDPSSNQCVKPYHDSNDLNRGGPHGQKNAVADIDGGKMDGFVAQAENKKKKKCADPNDPNCGNGGADVMGYHDEREIPNYWAYAKNFVLQDRMFEPNASWSLPEHLFLISEWSAKCMKQGDPMSCINALQNPERPPKLGKQRKQKRMRRAARMSNANNTNNGDANNAEMNDAETNNAENQTLSAPDYAWTDLTYLLHKNHISWAYYVLKGAEPDCEDDTEATCVQHRQN